MKRPSRSPSTDIATALQGKFGTILADPPWQFQNRTGKMAPEHKRLLRYPTMSLEEIMAMPIPSVAAERSHLYLWVPNALLREGLEVMEAWGFTYKSNLVWYKIRKDGGPDGRGVGFYFRNVTEIILFGTRGQLRTDDAGRRQVNLIATKNGSTHASRMNCTTSSRSAALDHFWSCLQERHGQDGCSGAIKSLRDAGIPTVRRWRSTSPSENFWPLDKCSWKFQNSVLSPSRERKV